MSSKGTPRVIIRMSEELQGQINTTIARRNVWTFDEGWTLSDFIRIACTEKLKKMQRSRTQGGRRRRRPGTSAAAGEIPTTNGGN